MQRLIFITLILGLSICQTGAYAKQENYVIDTIGAHAFINFRVKHLGYSWIFGQFKKFSGKFSYDKEQPSTAHIDLTIDTRSIDTNNTKRDKHLRGKAFLDTENHPEARFNSTSFTETTAEKAILTGDLTLHGITRQITIQLEYVGHGADPWGGYRRGFVGVTVIKPADFGINTLSLGPASQEIFFELAIEGLRLNNGLKKGKR